MTNALTNNTYQNLNEALLNDNSAKNTAEQSKDFTNIMNSAIKSSNTVSNPQNATTIGDIKASSASIPADKLANFREILTKETGDANVETSLNLTLARDISDIISQLKNSVTINEDGIEETEDISEDELSFEINTQTDNTKDETDTENNVVFEQILTLLNNITEATPEVVEDAVEKAVNVICDSINSTVKTETATQEIFETASKIIKDSTVKDEILEDIKSSLDEDMLKELNIEAMEDSTDADNTDLFSQKETAEEFGIKAMLNQHAEKAEISFNNIQTQISQPKTVDITPEKIIEQITKQMESMRAGSKLNIVLNPESLGKVNLQLINTKEGLSAQFTVTTNTARDLLMKGLDGLKESLLAQGVGVDNISVKVSETEESSYNPDWTEQENSGNGNKEHNPQNREEKNKGLFEKTIAKKFEENGNV